VTRPDKRKWILFAAVLCWNIAAAPQISGNDVHVGAEWDVGESRNYQVIAHSTEAFIEESISSVSYDIEVTVHGLTEFGYLLEWLYSNVTRTGGSSLRPVPCVAEGLRIRYSVDEFGALREIVNWEEIHTFLETSVIRIKAPGRDVYSADQFEELGQTLCPFADKDGMEKAGIEDIKLFHSLYGFRPVEPVKYRAHVRNPIFEEPFIVSAEATAADYYAREDQGRLKIERDFKLDSSSGPVHIELQWVFNHNLASTWVQSAYTEITSVSGIARRNETLVIRQSD
jgi:hypothetical protein